MAHAEGWIEAYGLIENDQKIPPDLKRAVLSNRNGVGETMLHWYAIEGDLKTVERIIDLGFDVNTQNDFKATPLFECVRIEKWDVVELLLRGQKGADKKGQV